ncbi:hypothetical protein MNBD_GAMMA12-2791 [hydrothermal vent metagenome]|uniref:HPP transmembrane region domain-containing protein n=1 Tax=hydrothermal vent metagenome TaxID=652676 RepID=A0A3B0YJ69_9ZZZZ
MSKRKRYTEFLKLLGLDWSFASHAERIVSAIGAFAGILIIFWISQYSLSASNAGLLIASMGASAVLLFAIPHGALSQPWNLIMGHFISAFIGITIAKLVSPILLAAALAVGLAVLAQYYLRCLHPPGGATALSAVIGGQQVTELGYTYIVTPVLLNTIGLMLVAILFNLAFSWRRYPAIWSYRHDKKSNKIMKDNDPRYPIRHEDLVFALSELDSFLDVTEDDLLHIYQLATQRSVVPGILPELLKTGHFYCNDHHGSGWEVRQIVDWQQSSKNSESTDNLEMLIYKTINKHGTRDSGVSTRIQFAHWANTEVVWENNEWTPLKTSN